MRAFSTGASGIAGKSGAYGLLLQSPPMSNLFGLIPAAGSGSRMGAQLPKQYLTLAGKPVLHHAVAGLCRNADIEAVIVVLSTGDKHFAQHDWSEFGDRLVPLYCGGATRADSVFNGLLAARDQIDADDWVLVHDAVRPCLAPAALARLIAAVTPEATGGLLALPVVDTLKRGDADGYVKATESREHLWRAQTPQMFRYRLLVEALHGGDFAAITDESSAIERLGLEPRLVAGDTRNLKITYPEDLALAEMLMREMEQSCG